MGPTLTATAARAKLFALLDQVAASHEPILITEKRNNAVLKWSESRKLKFP